jgi:hypothetical protein
VHQPVCIGIDVERLSKCNRRLDSASEELSCANVRLRVASGEHAKGDLRLTAVKRTAERTTASIPDRDDVAGIGADVDEIAAVDPRVTASKAILTARGDDNGWDGQENSWFRVSGFRVQGSVLGSKFKVQATKNPHPEP